MVGAGFAGSSVFPEHEIINANTWSCSPTRTASGRRGRFPTAPTIRPAQWSWTPPCAIWAGPVVVCDKQNRIIVLYRDNFGSNGLTIVSSLPYAVDPQRTNWTTFDLTTDNLGNYEPVIDLARWQRDNVLDIVYQASDGEGYTAPANNASPIGVLEWNDAAYFNYHPDAATALDQFETKMSRSRGIRNPAGAIKSSGAPISRQLERGRHLERHQWIFADCIYPRPTAPSGRCGSGGCKRRRAVSGREEPGHVGGRGSHGKRVASHHFTHWFHRGSNRAGGRGFIHHAGRPARWLLPRVVGRIQRHRARFDEMGLLAARQPARCRQRHQRRLAQRLQPRHHHLHQQQHPLHRDHRHRPEIPVAIWLLGGEHQMERQQRHVVGLLDAVAHPGRKPQ